MKLFVSGLIITCFFLAGFSAPGVLSLAAVQQESANVGFKWAFGAVVGGEKDRKLVSVAHDTTLRSGDEIKIMVELTRECFVYVIHHGPKSEIDLIFPYSLKQFMADYKVGKSYYFPPGRAWSKLDTTAGRETFYLLASSERLVQLEALLSTYMSSENAKKPDVAKDIVNEIRDVKKRFKTFTTIAEKPITIGGNVRGIEKVEEAKRIDISTVATQISASNFYSKTFTIDHK